MTIKKKARRKKMAKAGRPKGKSPSYVELGLRATKAEYDLIQQATEKNAERRHVIASRNNFCLRAAVAAAKRELGMIDDVPEEDGL
jgi:hypothetical protein